MTNENLSPEIQEIIKREMGIHKEHDIIPFPEKDPFLTGLYELNDMKVLPGFYPIQKPEISALQTIDDLLDKDKQREQDGFPRRIRLGKVVKPGKDNKNTIILVPTTTEPKFYHDNSITEDNEEQTGGSGEGEEGEVIGEQQAQPEGEEGEGVGAGQGDEASHDIGTEAFDLGKVLTEKFQLPNLKEKGKKPSFTKFTYDLTDKNRGFGQVLDHKDTIKRVIKTNIVLGNIKETEPFSPEDLLITPQDEVYRIMSKEKDYENQAVVFFLRDYSGSMQGKPTEVVVKQHLYIYSWLMYQYQKNVISRFILHDTVAKEVPDFYTYYRSQVAGGTNIYPAFEMVNRIVEEERLASDYNIYVFHGTDGDDWEENGEKMLDATKKMLYYVNRIGFIVAKNSWGYASMSVLEKYMEKSGLLKQRPDLIRLDAMPADTTDEKRIVESIKKLIS